MVLHSPITALTTLGCAEGLIDRILQDEDILTPNGLRSKRNKFLVVRSTMVKNCSRRWCKWQWTCLELVVPVPIVPMAANNDEQQRRL
jgi:hypothetical protein